MQIEPFLKTASPKLAKARCSGTANAVDKNLVQGAIKDVVLGRRRRRAVILGLLVLGAGAIVLYFSIPLASRLASIANQVITTEGMTASINKGDLNNYVQYGVWTVGGSLVAYGTNKIRRG